MATAGPRSLHRLLDGVLAVSSDLDLPTLLRRLVEVAADLVDARYGALGVLDADGTRLAAFITVGVDDATHDRIGHLPEGHGLLGALIVDERPLRLPDLRAHPDSFGFPPGHPPMRSFLGVPVRVRSEVFGNFYLTEKRTEEAFSDVDEELIVGLASAAGVAIENARLHARVADVALLEERERIARDLHDRVIQRLFAAGLSLQGTVPLVRRDADLAVERIESAIDDLDLTVKHIRSAIFGLEAERRPRSGLRERLLAVCREAADVLGFEPRVLLDGPVDAAVGDALAADLLAAVREGLSNVVRHAGATQVDVSVVTGADGLTLEVADDGGGPPAADAPRGSGLANLSARAERHGGTAGLRARPGGGTVLTWRAAPG